VQIYTAPIDGLQQANVTEYNGSYRNRTLTKGGREQGNSKNMAEARLSLTT